MIRQTYKLNPYAQIIEYPDKYVIYQAPDYTLEMNTLEIKRNDSKKVEILCELITGKAFLINQLSLVFEKNEIELLVKNKILMNEEIDINTIMSRTKMFYQQYISKRQAEMLYSSKVLILGCGGIGSTIAWQIAVLGVCDITIVDFDTVEESNLNRIPIFSMSDVGLKKVDVITQKLRELFPGIKINPIDVRISSEKKLEEICNNKEFDLIIKALDSPIQFPLWLDSVCKKNHYKYISGVTLRDRTLIGPTFIPGYAEIGYSDIMNIPENANKIFGTIPSVGLMLFRATDEMTIEAFKVLTGANDKLKYCHKIYAENLQTGELSYFQNKISRFDWEPPLKNTILLDIICVILLCLCTYQNRKMFFSAIVISAILPFLCYNCNKNIIKLEFLNAIIIGIMATIIMCNNNIIFGLNFITVSTICIILISITSFVYCFIGSSIIWLYKLLCRFRNRRLPWL